MVCTWTDGTCSVFKIQSGEESSKYYYRYEGLAEALIDFAMRQIDLWPLNAACSDATLDHFCADVLLPGILDHQGALVLHAGAAIIDGAAAVFVGASGRGKSTLTASYYADGHTILSDDGIIVTLDPGGPTAEAVYPGIRLLPETMADLFADTVPTTEVAHYATKRRLVPDERMSGTRFPAAAVFFLAESEASNAVTISPISAADACIGIVGKSFALDPSDKERARTRLVQVSRLANAIPTFSLAYPRKMSALPEVRQAIATALRRARCAPPCSAIAPPR